MNTYLKNTLERLTKYSETLDKKELFIDKHWFFIDEHLNKDTYIFRRDGELIMSKNGNVNIGKWEYLTEAKSLLIDRVTDKILLNQHFINPGVMILKKDGLNNDFFTIANQELIPDLNIVAYLNNLHQNILFEEEKKIQQEHQKILIEEEKKIQQEHQNNLIEEKKNKLRQYEKENKIYDSNYDRKIRIKQRIQDEPSCGDSVIIDNNAAQDGVYPLYKYGYIWVKDGHISKYEVASRINGLFGLGLVSCFVLLIPLFIFSNEAWYTLVLFWIITSIILLVIINTLAENLMYLKTVILHKKYIKQLKN